MRSGMLGFMIAAAVACGLAGCAPGGYASWANYREQQAIDHAYLSQRNAEAAQWQTEMGDYRGAQQTQAAAHEEAARAQQEQAHAARDRWLSRFQ
jgi:hypothetical protein